ncbi:hypothetical protein D0T12_08280 [Actinomadura spongiicola]|uniref:Uncharacterized protein n=1 Tax=Actinomadura spongiicola TaxID=2303421 RepID=A0A372GNC1_9ACTN|nr:hypothetical protein D0T12_08280 [Actinomadura spongiicola]
MQWFGAFGYGAVVDGWFAVSGSRCHRCGVRPFRSGVVGRRFAVFGSGALGGSVSSAGLLVGGGLAVGGLCRDRFGVLARRFWAVLPVFRFRCLSGF